MGRTHRGWTTVLAMGAIAAYSPQRSRCAIRQSLAWHSFEQYLAILHLLHLRSCSGIPLNVQLKAQHRLSHSCGSPFGSLTISLAEERLEPLGRHVGASVPADSCLSPPALLPPSVWALRELAASLNFPRSVRFLWTRMRKSAARWSGREVLGRSSWETLACSSSWETLACSSWQAGCL